MFNINRFISRLQSLAHAVWHKPLYQHIFFAIATIVSVSLMGYYFGTFDQVSHIPFLKKNADPTLYQGDSFFDLRKTHYSYFWLFFIPFYHLNILEISMFIIYLISVYLTYWALWRLSKTIFNNPLTSFLTVVIFTLPHLSFGMFTLVEFSLLNRTFVLPFLLLAIDFYLRRKYNLSFLIMGLMYNLHVISVNFVLFMIFFDLILRIKQVGLKRIFLSMAVFFIGALPVLVWKFGHSPVDFGINKDWFSIINLGILYHLFNIISTNFKIDLLSIGAFGSIMIYFLARRYIRAAKYDRIITNFICALILLLIIEVITSHWLPITIVIQSQIIRGAIFIVIFAFLYLAHFLASQYEAKELQGYNFILLLSASIFSIFPSIFVLFWFINQIISSKFSARTAKPLLKIAITAVFVVFLLQGIIANSVKVWRPGIHVFAEKSAYYDVQVWAKEYTPKDTVFITPPYTWWFYDLEWRVVSERPTVGAISELLEAAFDPGYIKIWKPKFEDIAPGALSQFKGDYFENIKIMSDAYYSLSVDKIKTVAKKYNASYLVVEKPHKYNLPVIYENRGYAIYDIRSFIIE